MSNATRRSHESKTLKYEQDAAADVARNLDQQFVSVFRTVTAAYVRFAGSTTKPLPPAAQKAMKLVVAGALGAVRVSARLKLQRAVKGALGLGVDMAKMHTDKKVVVSPRADREVRRAIKDIEKKAQADIDAALKTLRSRPLLSFTSVNIVLNQARQSVVRVENTTRWATNKAVNTGSAVVIRAIGAEAMWVHEEGACLTCLAYSGTVVKVGDPFPVGKTYGDPGTSTVKTAIDGPPAHPNCRCRLVPWMGSESGVGPVEAPDALKREAQREVLRGTAGASEASRLRAADRLLKAGSSLPKTVQKRARIAVQAGKFRAA